MTLHMQLELIEILKFNSIQFKNIECNQNFIEFKFN